jgi:hypothetical protein
VSGLRATSKDGAAILAFIAFVAACSSSGSSHSPGDASVPSVVYSVGGAVTGLPGGAGTGTLTLLNDGSDNVMVTEDGPFNFPIKLASGAPYAVTVNAAPTGVTCQVSDGVGHVAGANVTNVAVSCSGAGEHDASTGKDASTGADSGHEDTGTSTSVDSGADACASCTASQTCGDGGACAFTSCTSNTDCPYGYCDENRLCQNCLTLLQCPLGEACAMTADGAGQCVTPGCTSYADCGPTEDCASGLASDDVDYSMASELTCVPAPKCSVDADCTFNVCRGGRCVTTCASNADCTAVTTNGQLLEECDTALGACYRICTGLGCADFEFCNPRGFCQPEACQTSTQCPTDSMCDLSSQQCTDAI